MSAFPPRKTFTFALTGGLDEVTQPLAIDPGRAIAAMNHEAIDAGYGRIFGFERFDGRTSPHDFPFYLIDFTGGVGAITATQTITGQTSGATGVVLVDVALTTGAWDGTGTGTIGFRSLTGNFVAGENIRVGGVTKAVAVAAQTIGIFGSDDDAEKAWSEAARDYARTLILTVPGSGVIRGVWEMAGVVYAIRDNAGATAGVLHKSTAGGWSAVSLGHTVAFTSGGVYEVVEGNTITGATSAATGVVRRVVIQSGDWAGGTAAGYFVLSGIVGTFQAENLNVGANLNVATIAGAPTATTLPAGGRYFFVSHNFYALSSTRRIYGCNGVGRGFEFDGTYFIPIQTAETTDTPNRVAVFRNHLFFAFPGGRVQHSAPGDPVSWEAITGALEFGIGSEVADFIPNIDSLAILGEHGIFALTGTDSTDWVLSTITLEAGAKPFTGQRLGPGIYLDNRGVRSISASQAYGNFAMGTFSAAVNKTFARKAVAGAAPIASCIVRTKNHYRVFYDDGSGLSFYMGRKFPEPMYFDLGKIVRCISSNESDEGVERVFFGSDDGYVYQLDKGISFDGEPIEAYAQLAYVNMRAPNVLKRVHKIELELSASGWTELGISAEYDYSQDEQTGTSSASLEAYGSGGLWGIVEWGSFFWGAPVENTLEADIDGMGRNVSTVIYSNSHLIAPYELRGVNLHYSERGMKR